MELISVIVPIYKAEKYLNRCIESIVKQTYDCLEIILVDDGSTDTSPQICDNWGKKDDRIKVVHQKNGGVSSARNSGLNIASGKYIVQVDSDDYIASNMIEVLYKALIEKNADLVICGYLKGKNVDYSFALEKEVETTVINAETALNRIYDSGASALQYVAPWGKLYKKELFEEIRYPEGKIFEDIYITHQILCRCHRIAVVQNQLTYYYQHSDSIMNKKYHVGKLDYLDACKNRISFFKENGYEQLAHIAYDEYLHSLIWEYSRARDLLADKSVMQSISKRFREIYRKGYASVRYPAETKYYLSIFNINPELIVWYWRVASKLKRKRTEVKDNE